MSNLAEIRNRFVPILRATIDQYQGRVPAGYPNLIDDVEGGTLGLELDSSYGVYVTEDESGLFAEIYKRDARTDTRGYAGYQKYAGQPFSDRRPLESVPTDQELRNLVAELKQAFNTQPGLLYITDD